LQEAISDAEGPLQLYNFMEHAKFRQFSTSANITANIIAMPFM